MSKFVLYIGPHGLDLMPLQGKLLDCEEGGLQGLRPHLQGFESMRLGLAEAMPLYGAAAGKKNAQAQAEAEADAEANVPTQPVSTPAPAPPA